MTLIEEYAIRNRKSPCVKCGEKKKCEQPFDCPAFVAHANESVFDYADREYRKHLDWMRTTWRK